MLGLIYGRSPKGWLLVLANYHRSYVRMKLERLRETGPGFMRNFEEWLIEVAKLRADKITSEPLLTDVRDEELIIGLLLLENLDRPGLLASAALMLSRLAVGQKELARLAKQERVDFLLPALTGRLEKNRIRYLFPSSRPSSGDVLLTRAFPRTRPLPSRA